MLTPGPAVPESYVLKVACGPEIVVEVNECIAFANNADGVAWYATYPGPICGLFAPVDWKETTSNGICTVRTGSPVVSNVSRFRSTHTVAVRLNRSGCEAEAGSGSAQYFQHIGRFLTFSHTGFARASNAGNCPSSWFRYAIASLTATSVYCVIAVSFAAANDRCIWVITDAVNTPMIAATKMATSIAHTIDPRSGARRKSTRWRRIDCTMFSELTRCAREAASGPDLTTAITWHHAQEPGDNSRSALTPPTEPWW